MVQDSKTFVNSRFANAFNFSGSVFAIAPRLQFANNLSYVLTKIFLFLYASFLSFEKISKFRTKLSTISSLFRAALKISCSAAWCLMKRRVCSFAFVEIFSPLYLSIWEKALCPIWPNVAGKIILAKAWNTAWENALGPFGSYLFPLFLYLS